MKSICIISTSKDTYFKSNLLCYLKSMEIDFNEYNETSIKDKEIDYVILNSGKGFERITIKSKYCFINMDHWSEKELNIFGNIITYGLGNKNTVTISSIEDVKGEFVYCLQRFINHQETGIFEPQEIPVTMNVFDERKLYAAMVAITIALIEGKTKEFLCQLYFN